MDPTNGTKLRISAKSAKPPKIIASGKSNFEAEAVISSSISCGNRAGTDFLPGEWVSRVASLKVQVTTGNACRLTRVADITN